MARRLFCEISPLMYKISVTKNIWIRKMEWYLHRKNILKHLVRKDFLLRFISINH